MKFILYFFFTILSFSLLLLPHYNFNNLLVVASSDFKSVKPLFGTVCSDQTQPDIIIDFVLVNNSAVPITIPPICLQPPDSGLNINRNLTGNDEPNVIFGRDGLDVIEGKGGDDILNGGNDDDEIYGDDGNDVLYGSFSDDVLYGGDDNDLIVGYFGEDFLSGDEGQDELYGGPGNDVLRGGPGADFLDCGSEMDTVLDFDPTEGDSLANNCEQVYKSGKK